MLLPLIKIMLAGTVSGHGRCCYHIDYWQVLCKNVVDVMATCVELYLVDIVQGWQML